MDKKKKVKIAPSILSADFMNLQKEIESIERAGADLIHLDIMDNHFVPNLTFGFPIIKQISKITNIPLDVHLMVTNPEDCIKKLSSVPIKYLSFHIEVAPHTNRIVQQIKSFGKKAGVVLNPSTPISQLKNIIQDVDFVLLMSVNPGFGGQSFLPVVYEKIEELKVYREKYQFLIEVDGGVSNINSTDLINSGVDILVVGSYIFKSENYKQQIQKLTKKA